MVGPDDSFSFQNDPISRGTFVHFRPGWCRNIVLFLASQIREIQPGKIHMEPKNHLTETEHHLPNLLFFGGLYVVCEFSGVYMSSFLAPKFEGLLQPSLERVLFLQLLGSVHPGGPIVKWFVAEAKVVSTNGDPMGLPIYKPCRSTIWKGSHNPTRSLGDEK